MNYEIVELPARTVAGPAVRASNNSPEEGAVIGQLWQRFMGEGDVYKRQEKRKAKHRGK